MTHGLVSLCQSLWGQESAGEMKGNESSKLWQGRAYSVPLWKSLQE